MNRLIKSRIKSMVFVQYVSIQCNSLRINIVNYPGYKKFGTKLFQYNMYICFWQIRELVPSSNISTTS